MRFVRGTLAVIALLVSLAALPLWARSYYVVDALRRGDDANYLQIRSAAGSIVFTRGQEDSPTTPRAIDAPWRYERIDQPRNVLKQVEFRDRVFNRLGFAYSKQFVVAPQRVTLVNFAFPHWLICLLLAPPALRWLLRRPAVEEPPLLECPRCGQMFAQLPLDCPVCGHRLQETSAAIPPDA